MHQQIGLQQSLRRRDEVVVVGGEAVARTRPSPTTPRLWALQSTFPSWFTAEVTVSSLLLRSLPAAHTSRPMCHACQHERLCGRTWQSTAARTGTAPTRACPRRSPRAALLNPDPDILSTHLADVQLREQEQRQRVRVHGARLRAARPSPHRGLVLWRHCLQRVHQYLHARRHSNSAHAAPPYYMRSWCRPAVPPGSLRTSACCSDATSSICPSILARTQFCTCNLLPVACRAAQLRHCCTVLPTRCIPSTMPTFH